MNQHTSNKPMHLPPSVKNLVATIQERSPANNNEIAALVKQHPIDHDELLPFNNFEHPVHESYGRRQLYAGNRFCIYLMSWCPGDFTAIHDHGTTQWGCVLALDDFAHRLYQFKNNKLVLKDDKPFLKGQTASVHSHVIHMMGNDSNENALSIHIYGTNDPGIQVAQKSRIFYPEINQMAYTQGAAYLFNPQYNANKMIDFENIDEETRNDYFALINAHRTMPSPFNIVH
jgi:cysteine dioxygenase